MTDYERAMELARRIATAVFHKLQVAAKYDVSVRRHAEPVQMPWIEIAWRLKGKPPETHEWCISLPEVHFKVETKEESSELAQYIYKTTGMMLGLIKKEVPKKNAVPN